MKNQVFLNVEELEDRIPPDSIHGVPGESNGNPGNEVSNGSKPQPSVSLSPQTTRVTRPEIDRGLTR